MAVTPDRVAERDDARQLDALAAALVIEIASAASGEGDLEAILHATLDRLGALVPFTGGSIAVVAGDTLVVRAAVGPFADEAIGTRLLRGHSLSWEVVASGEPRLIDDLETSGRRVRTPRAAAAVRSWLAVPLVRHGEGIGLLEVDSIEPDAFDAGHIQLMTTIARVLSGSVEVALAREAERTAGAIRDAFVGIIGHELRTPITTIYGSSKILRRRWPLLSDDAREQLIGDVEEEADRLHRMVDDLLVLSRAESGRIELSDEPVLVGSALRHATTAARARNPGHRFELSVPPELPPIRGEETYLEQVVGNLLSNAAKYSPTGTTIRVEAEAGSEVVAVRVLDEGIGITADEAPQLFELFYRSPGSARSAAGTGIGLFVCRAIVEAMGGRIWARPREGSGAEFGLELPIYAIELDEEPAEPA